LTHFARNSNSLFVDKRKRDRPFGAEQIWWSTIDEMHMEMHFLRRLPQLC